MSKEVAYYQKEAGENEARVQGMKDEGKDIYDVSPRFKMHMAMNSNKLLSSFRRRRRRRHHHAGRNLTPRGPQPMSVLVSNSRSRKQRRFCRRAI